MTRAKPLAAALGLALLPAALSAQSDPRSADRVILDSGQGAGHSGRLAVNIAAGVGNQQASSAILAIGDLALTQGQIIQHAEANTVERATQIVLGPGTFSGTSGLVSVNISAGTQNQSANLAALAIGRSGALSDELLAQTRAPHEPSGGTAMAAAGRDDTIAIDDGAFAQGSGLFQANLMAGERNSSANTFSLTVTAGGQP